MNDKIKELKDLLFELDSKHSVSVTDTQQNINDVAKKIVKLFAIPVVSERYSKDDIRKYGNDWKITTWDEGQQRRRIMAEGYKTRDEAEHDREIFNAR